jgi:hypothetical protein
LPRWRFWIVFISLMVSIFLFALGECGPQRMDVRDENFELTSV